jgi:hypothetical protein
MIKSVKIVALVVSISLLAPGCAEEVTPQGGGPSQEQVAGAPGAFDGLVSGLTSSLAGSFLFGTGNTYPWDFGYPSFFISRDVMGQDILCDPNNNDWFNTWYYAGTGLGPQYLNCQIPWSYYYKWINNCNTVLGLIGDEPDELQRNGTGIAYAMRALFYMDLVRMFQYTYVADTSAPTVPIVTHFTTPAELTMNPRAPQNEVWAFILDDLDKAELYIAGYERDDFTTPDLSVVYGLKARAYLTMENWPEAERYAKLAQTGYTITTKEQYTDRLTAFNTATGAWMLGLRYIANSDNVMLNDSDSNWGSQMFLEVRGGLYGSAYGGPKNIDAHLYETIPTTDFRKDCYIDPALDEMTPADRTAALIARFSDYPEYIDQCVDASSAGRYGYLPLKFRAAGGAAGRTNPYAATAASVPMMRVEEMILIEAEAAGMQDEARGKALLTAFALTRDPSYVYNDNPGVTFRDNVWWQRRVELWGEGFSTFDIKRLQKGIIRSYAGTNHTTGYRWNTDGVPHWMNFCIVQTEGNYNFGLGDNNPTPTPPTGDSPAHVW